MQSLANGKVLGAYTIVRLIGRGGMGEVYEAYEHRLQRKVALKVIAPQKSDTHGESDLVRRFMQEARTLAQVNHPNVVTIYSIDKIGDVQFIAMEYVEGSSFKDIFSLFAFSADEGAPIFLQLLEGLRSLHENKILHRDIKPHNLMIRPNGQVKILDFGIAKRLNDRERENTTAGVVVGTLAYLPPEVLYGTPATVRSDIWSLGAIFYECMVGQPLVSIHSVKVKGVRAATDSDVVFPQEVLGWIPTEMRMIVGKMSDRKPDNRYASTDEVIEALKHYQGQRPPLPQGMMSAFLNIVSDLEAYKKANEIKKPATAKAKRALMLTLLNGRPVSAESSKIHSEESAPSQVEVTKDSISARRKAQRQARKKRKSNWFMPAAGAALVTALVLMGAIKLVREKFNRPVKPAEPAVVEQVKLVSPVANQGVWLEPNQLPTLTWSKPLLPGEYELQIANDPNFNAIVIREEASGTSYRPARVLGEGEYYWQLWPIRAALKPVGPEHFTLNHLSAIEVSWPKSEQIFDIRKGARDVNLNFTWRCKPGAKKYRVQIGTDSSFLNIKRQEVTELCSWNDLDFQAGTFHWRVRVDEPLNAQSATVSKHSFTVRNEGKATMAAPPVAVAPPVTPVLPQERVPAVPTIKNPKQNFMLQVKDAGAARDVASLRQLLQSHPEFQWQAVKGAKSYDVQISWVPDFSRLLSEETVTAPRLKWTQVIPGSFYWRVRVGGDSPGAYSSPGKLEVLVPEPKLASSYVLKDGAPLDWKPVPFADKYIVQYSPDRAMASVTEKQPSLPEAQFDKSIIGTVYVRVAAANLAGERVSGFSQVASVNLEQAVRLAAPGILTPPRGAKVVLGKHGRISVVFTWTKGENAADYMVQISSQPDFSEILAEKTLKSPHWLLKGAKLNGKVYWRVRSQSTTGHGPWSKPGFFEVR